MSGATRVGSGANQTQKQKSSNVLGATHTVPDTVGPRIVIKSSCTQRHSSWVGHEDCKSKFI